MKAIYGKLTANIISGKWRVLFKDQEHSEDTHLATSIKPIILKFLTREVGSEHKGRKKKLLQFVEDMILYVENLKYSTHEKYNC